MANATSITVNDLVANGSLADPTPDVLDTGTTAVTIRAAVSGKSDRVIFRVKNTDNDTAMTVFCPAGDNPPALLAGKGAQSAVTVAFGATKWFGPYESGQFMQNDSTSKGAIALTITPASGTISAEITCFRLPRV